MNQTITIEDITTLVVRFTDSIENEEFDNKDLNAQDRVDNMFKVDYANGLPVMDILALDGDENVIGRLTAQEFFGERIGF